MKRKNKLKVTKTSTELIQALRRQKYIFGAFIIIISIILFLFSFLLYDEEGVDFFYLIISIFVFIIGIIIIVRNHRMKKQIPDEKELDYFSDNIDNVEIIAEAADIISEIVDP